MSSLTKICIQKILPQHKDYFHNINNDDNLHPEHSKQLRAAFFTQKLRKPYSDINIYFLEKSPENLVRTRFPSDTKLLDPLQNEVENMDIIEAIKKIVKERIQPLVNLNINFVKDKSKSNVRISFKPELGSWSLLGTDADLTDKETATINFGWFDVPTVIHEFGHMLGMIHEHQNPRGVNIQWNKSKLFEWARETQGWDEQTTSNNIINKYDIDYINGSDFDPQSIMLYFYPAYLTLNNVGTKQNLRLSGEDVLWITKMYPKTNGISAEEFYQQKYGEPLKSNIQDSEKESKQFENGSTPVFQTIYITYILYIIGIVLLVLFTIFLIRHALS